MHYLFTGPETCLKEKAIEDLKSKLLGGDKSNLNFSIYHAGNDDIKDILLSAKTMPFFGKSKIIVIKDIDKLNSKEKKALSEYLKNPSRHCAIVFETQKTSIKKDEFVDIALKTSRRLNFEAPRFERLNNWIKNEAAALNKKISKDAVESLKELAGAGDLSALKNELNKISIFIGDKKEIERMDVEKITGQNAEKDIFELADAISRKDVSLSFKIISGLLSRKTKPHEIIGLLAWHFRKLSGGNQKVTSSESVRLKQIKELLLDSDFAIKRRYVNPNIVLEFTVLELCR